MDRTQNNQTMVGSAKLARKLHHWEKGILHLLQHLHATGVTYEVNGEQKPLVHTVEQKNKTMFFVDNTPEVMELINKEFDKFRGVSTVDRSQVLSIQECVDRLHHDRKHISALM